MGNIRSNARNGLSGPVAAHSSIDLRYYIRGPHKKAPLAVILDTSGLTAPAQRPAGLSSRAQRWPAGPNCAQRYPSHLIL